MVPLTAKSLSMGITIAAITPQIVMRMAIIGYNINQMKVLPSKSELLIRNRFWTSRQYLHLVLSHNLRPSI